jgi:serine phosphatase RsbU (regulator of sigma subunit)
LTVTTGLTGTPRRVLLVEDDAGDALLVQEMLADSGSEIELLHATSIAEAVSSGLLAVVDCVLLDLNLPGTGTDRLDALRQLREHDQNSAICVLTGLDDEQTGAAAMAAGAQDYLVKGKVDGDQLSRTVRYSVERKRGERTAVRLAEAQRDQAESIRVERGLLPRLLLDGSDIGAQPYYRSGRRRSLLGGDFYDAIRCPDGSVHAVIGDVAGHGPDEAALGAQLRVAWRALVLSGVGEPKVLPALQQVLISERHARGLFTTLCTVAFQDGRAHTRVAGHPPPILLGPEPVELPHVKAPPLGVMPDCDWPITEFELPPHSSLLLYTDGLIEGFAGPERTDRLWNDGLMELVTAEFGDTGTLPHKPEELPARLVEGAEERNGGPLTDDVAILLLTTTPADGPDPG